MQKSWKHIKKHRKNVSYKVTNVSWESLKHNEPICNSQSRCDFTNNVKISWYNQLETVLGVKFFSDTPVGNITADELTALSFISSREHWQRFSRLQICNMSRPGFELTQKVSKGFAEWSCAVVIITTPRCQN